MTRFASKLVVLFPFLCQYKKYEIWKFDLWAVPIEIVPFNQTYSVIFKPERLMQCAMLFILFNF